VNVRSAGQYLIHARLSRHLLTGPLMQILGHVLDVSCRQHPRSPSNLESFNPVWPKMTHNPGFSTRNTDCARGGGRRDVCQVYDVRQRRDIQGLELADQQVKCFHPQRNSPTRQDSYNTAQRKQDNLCENARDFAFFQDAIDVCVSFLCTICPKT